MQLTCYDISAIRGMLLSGADQEIIHLKTGYEIEDILKIKKELENEDYG